LVLADAGRRRLLDDNQTLFAITPTKCYESDQFNQLYCR
jgi:hypothetical protein